MIRRRRTPEGRFILPHLRPRSHWFIAKVILSALVSAGLFRLTYDWLR